MERGLPAPGVRLPDANETMPLVANRRGQAALAPWADAIDLIHLGFLIKWLVAA